MQPLLKLEHVECRYAGQPVVHDLSLEVTRGDFVCLLGPSGCGKTTVLRALAGLEPIHGGEIVLDGRSLSRPGFTLSPEKRRIGMVFQDYALFPHMDVAENVGFGLRRTPLRQRKAMVEGLLETVGLGGFAHRYAHELSGGQQQRVALARALATAPDLILLDEPFSNLDVDMRERLSLEVRRILKSRGITAILVTHDQHEAFAISDRIGVMHQGRLLQWDTAYQLYHEPATEFVADFIGQGVFLKGTLLAPDTVETEIGIIRGDRHYEWPRGTPLRVLLRPDDIVPDDERGDLSGEVLHRAFKGAEIMYTLRLSTGSRVLSMFPSHHDHQVGDRVQVRLAADHLVVFPRHAEN